MAKCDNGFLIFHDWKTLFTHTPAEDCKRILLAMFEYSQSGAEPPQFEGIAEITASVIFPAMKRYRKRVESGRKGGLASAKKATVEGTAEGTTEYTTEYTAEYTTEYTTDNKTIQDKTNQDQDKTHTPSPFGEFWEAYPKKVRRRGAESEWEKLSPDGELTGIILSAVERQKQTALWQREGGRYIPDPSNWLRDRRWEDELSASAPKDEGSFATDQFVEAALRRTLESHGIS